MVFWFIFGTLRVPALQLEYFLKLNNHQNIILNRCSPSWWFTRCSGGFSPSVFSIFWLPYLNNYFDFHVCLSIRVCVCPCVWKLTPLPAVIWQNVINKSWLVYVKSEKYAFWVTLTPQWDRCCWGKAEVRIIHFKPHVQSFRRQVRLLLNEGKPS